MKVTFPHMGHINIPLKSFFETLGVEVVEPPPITQKTISLGSRYAPEFACLPLKINVGNYLEAAERGADTILMAGGVGPCRFGYYAQVQREIMADLGLDYRMVVLEPPRGHLRATALQLWDLTGRSSPLEIWRAGRLAWAKLQVLDHVDRLAAWTRCREKRKGETNDLQARAREGIDSASSLTALSQLRERITQEFGRVETIPGWEPLRIGLVGEIYTLLEPAANLELEVFLGSLGVEVNRSIHLSEWVISNLFLDALRIRQDQVALKEVAKPYLGHSVGGHGLENISHTIDFARRHCDGVIHLGPLTCMPEIVAKTILPRVSQDFNIPVLSVFVDEHTGELGLQTRVEAFVEMLQIRRERLREGQT